MSCPDDDAGNPEVIFGTLAPLMAWALQEQCRQNPEKKEALFAFSQHCKDGDIHLSQEHIALLKELLVIEADGSIRDYMKALINLTAFGEGSTFQLMFPTVRAN